jgi:hypothetical protein
MEYIYKYNTEDNRFSKEPVVVSDKRELDKGTEIPLTVLPFDNYDFDSYSMTNTELKKAILENFKRSDPAFPTQIPWNNYETLIGLIVAAGDLCRSDDYILDISSQTIEYLAELLRRQIVNLVS